MASCGLHLVTSSIKGNCSRLIELSCFLSLLWDGLWGLVSLRVKPNLVSLTVIFIGFILFLPLTQRPIVGKRCHTTCLCKIGGLFVIGFKLDDVSTNTGHSKSAWTALGSFLFFLLLKSWSLAENTVMISSTSWANYSPRDRFSLWLMM